MLSLLQLDENNDMLLDFDEFCKLMCDMENNGGRDQEKELWEAFKVFDINGDGTIERDELVEVRTRL